MTVSQAERAGLRVKRRQVPGLGMTSALIPDAHAPCQDCGHTRRFHSYDPPDFPCRHAECDCRGWDPFITEG
jgi:hypothetical protein